MKPKLTSNGFPAPRQVKCFQCLQPFFIKYVVPNKAYSRKNNWEYWTNPQAQNPSFWTNKSSRLKDRQICNTCLLDFYYDKETYWATILDLKKRQQLRKYVYDKTISV